jgi:hypothetical protein
MDPKIIQIKNVVMAAMADLNVMYLKTLKPEKRSLNE